MTNIDKNIDKKSYPVPMQSSAINTNSTKSFWWGKHHLALGQIKTWQFQERFISIKRSESEWSIFDFQTATEEECEIQVLSDTKSEAELLESAVKSQRFMLHQTKDYLIVEPSLADRAMIARPSREIHILPEQQIKFYVSSPLWFTVLCDDNSPPICDLPFWRPSDSWFGPSTMSGDLCYAKLTDAKTEMADLDKRENRALTRVTIENKQETSLAVKQINIPVPSLKLYHDNMGKFWTDDINIVQQIEHKQAVSTLKYTAPLPANEYTLVSESRELSKKNSLFTTIKSLIG